MITNNGKQLVAKYLIEQAPSYASHIAVGCGLNPDSSTAGDTFLDKTRLDFEMFRVPIISRSYTVENGISKILFAAELPSQEIYYMSEAGLYSSGSNPIATVSDSRMLYTFSSSENWEYHKASEDAVEITSYDIGSEPLANGSGVITSNSNLQIPFHIDSTDPLFSNAGRIGYLEQPRFLNNSIMISGGMSTINTAPESGTWTIDTPSTEGSHIHFTNQSLNLDINSSVDELILAFCVIKKDPNDSNPTSVKLMVEFSTSEIEEDGGGEYARMQVELGSSDFTTNGDYYYFVRSVSFGELKRSSSFAWSAVQVVKVYVDISNDDDCFVILDGLRFENNKDMQSNPLYAMVSYSPLYTDDDPDFLPIVKDANTNNIIEVEFDVDSGVTFS